MIKHKLYTRRTKRLSTHKTITWSYPAYRTDFLLLQPSFKKMAVNRFAIHMLSIFNCMSQHYIHTVYCYKTFHYKRYIKYKYILFITMLPYRITTKHVITLTVKSPNIENKTVCKFRSNIKDICILNTMRICFKTTYVRIKLRHPHTTPSCNSLWSVAIWSLHAKSTPYCLWWVGHRWV